MIRGGDFYAIWLQERGLWSTDEQDALQLIDRELDNYADAHKADFDNYRVLHMWDAESGMIDILAPVLSATDAGFVCYAR